MVHRCTRFIVPDVHTAFDFLALRCFAAHSRYAVSVPCLKYRSFVSLRSHAANCPVVEMPCSKPAGTPQRDK